MKLQTFDGDFYYINRDIDNIIIMKNIKELYITNNWMWSAWLLLRRLT